MHQREPTDALRGQDGLHLPGPEPAEPIRGTYGASNGLFEKACSLDSRYEIEVHLGLTIVSMISTQQKGLQVGMLIGLYSLCEVICSPFWGFFADKVGRKPALLIGLGGSVVAPIMFGLGKSMPVIFAARALDGFFCGNMGVTRTYLGEIVDESNEAWRARGTSMSTTKSSNL